MKKQKSSLFLYKSLFPTIPFYSCQNIHFTNIFINKKNLLIEKFRTFLENIFCMSSLFINKLYFSL